jgi:hypothetical protein
MTTDIIGIITDVHIAYEMRTNFPSDERKTPMIQSGPD